MGCFQSKNDEMKTSECIVCYEKTELLTNFPCGHCVCCERCAKRLSENSRFLQYIKVYNNPVLKCPVCRTQSVAVKIYENH